MKPDKKAVIAFCCGIAGLITGYIDILLAFATVMSIVGTAAAISALKGGPTPSGRGIAAAGMISSLFALCISIGGVLGYIAVLLMM